MNISHSFLTLSRRRITPWRENPILISNMIVDTSDTSPTTSVITSIERKTPIREFLSMKKSNLSRILCFSPISLIEPKEFLERRFDPSRPGPWRNMNGHNYTIKLYIYQSPEVSSRYFRNQNQNRFGG